MLDASGLAEVSAGDSVPVGESVSVADVGAALVVSLASLLMD